MKAAPLASGVPLTPGQVLVVTGTAPGGLTWEFPGRDGPDEPEAEA